MSGSQLPPLPPPPPAFSSSPHGSRLRKTAKRSYTVKDSEDEGDYESEALTSQAKSSAHLPPPPPASSSSLMSRNSRLQSARKRALYTIEDFDDERDTLLEAMTSQAKDTSSLPPAVGYTLPRLDRRQISSKQRVIIEDSEDDVDLPESSTSQATSALGLPPAVGNTLSRLYTIRTHWEDLPIPLSDARLFNISATTEDVLEDIHQAFPLLHPSTNPKLQEFKNLVHRTLATCSASTFPNLSADSSGPPNVNPGLDVYWAKCVQDEPKLVHGTYHKGLDMDPRLIVKPWETMQSAVVTCPPTLQSTQQFIPTTARSETSQTQASQHFSTSLRTTSQVLGQSESFLWIYSPAGSTERISHDTPTS